MEINYARFLGSWERTDQMPRLNFPEFAFIGRSNVGKSSLINMLCNRKGLAKTSSTPGKTQTINLFELNHNLLFCDLPGYGYAKVSKKDRFKFAGMITYYLKERENLLNLFILVDLRIPPQAVDIAFINQCGEDGIPFVLVGTKTDKLNEAELALSIGRLTDALSESWEELPMLIPSSSENGLGKEAILNYIHQCMKEMESRPEL